MYLVTHSFDPRFVSLLGDLRKTYGERMFELEGIGSKDLDINHFSKQYYTAKSPAADNTIDSNANVDDTSVVTWEKEAPKPILKLNSLYMLWKDAEEKMGIKRANKMIEGEIAGWFRIHDLYKWLFPYCMALDLEPLVTRGMPFYPKIKIGPIKHFYAFVNVVIQYVCFSSNHLAGAVSLPNLFPYMDYFIRKDFGERWYEDKQAMEFIKQALQSFIYSLNFNYRSNQTAFTNISVYDDKWLESMFSNHMNPDHSGPSFENIKRVQKLFVDEMLANLKDNPFTFPVMTACMLYDRESRKFHDVAFAEWISDISKDTGLFNLYVDEDTASLSQCCRLRSNLNNVKEKQSYTNTFGVGGVTVGSHRVVALNLVNIAHSCKDWEEFKKELAWRVDLTHDILDTHRAMLQKLIDDGRLPLYTYKFMFLKRQYSTVGFIGMHEALKLLGFDMLDKVGSERAVEIVELINTMNAKRAEKTGNIYNVEQVPGESAASNLAMKDALQFPNKEVHQIYSNQYVPLSRVADLTDRIKAQGLMDKRVSGGSILHINVDEHLTKRQVMKILLAAADKGVVYFAINLSISKCVSCGKVHAGRHDLSPCHKSPVIRFMRVVGYLTPVPTWGAARREEYKTRQFYSMEAFG